jgi:hypothetical protein
LIFLKNLSVARGRAGELMVRPACGGEREDFYSVKKASGNQRQQQQQQSTPRQREGIKRS